MKFTRSLAAKAIARANVPIRMIGFRMLTRRSSRMWKMTAETAKIAPMISHPWPLIQSLVSEEMNDALLAPLTRMK